MTEPSDDQVHRYVQRLLSAKSAQKESELHLENLLTIIRDLWALRERDQREYEEKLGGQRVSAREADSLIQRMRRQGVL